LRGDDRVGEASVDVAAWLHGLGLQQYEQSFRDNAIDAATLPELTSEDLKDLGINLVGHRRKLLAAIAALGDEVARESVAGASLVERRQLTVMFCDLVGSTALSTRRDPEDLRDLIAAYHHAVADVVKRFEGFVARYMGDGILIYFGYPRAHEDDAERASRCALGVVEAISGLKLVEALHARIGIATGMVVVGGGASEHDVVGETPNLAARLQTLAEPNTVLIDENTRRLVGRLFEYRDLGPVEARGFAGTVSAWQILRPSTVASRFEALRASSVTPLIGRDEEIELLLRRWQHAKKGEGQGLLLSGEPGIGKSRIAAALAERLRGEPHYHLRYFCAPHHQSTALYPVIAHLEDAAGFARDDSPSVKLDKLRRLFGEGRLGQLRRRVAYQAAQRSRGRDREAELLLLTLAGVRQALVADLLSLPTAGALPDNLSPQRKKEKTLEALLDRLQDLSRKRPVLMVFEDVHWIDPTSRELLDLTIERIRQLPVLLIITFRPEFEEAWSGAAHVSGLQLNRLAVGEATVLAETAAGKALPDEVATHIAARADGIPLFVEELTRAVVESGLLHDEGDRFALDRAIPSLAIPPSLHASLLARLDRLGPIAKAIAQIGSAIGRDFSYELLAAAAEHGEAELQSALDRLVDAGLVFQRGAPPDANFLFKHTLVQDAAYGTLLRGPRQLLHARIAEALETKFPELMDSTPELFAHHYAEARLVEKAAAFWGRAGQWSMARSAVAEAVAQFQRALDQLALVVNTPERQRQELELRSSLGAALMVVKGFAAPETGHAYARARELWETLGSPSEFLHIPRGQSIYYAVRGELDLALRLDEDLLRVSRQRNDAAGLVLGHVSAGRTLMFIGRLSSSQSHLEEVLALSDTVSRSSLLDHAGVDPYVNSLALLGSVHFCRGFPDRALARSNAAITEAQRLGHQPSLAVTFALGARLMLLLGDNAALGELAGQLIAISTEQSFAYWRALGEVYGGWVRVKDGDVAEGLRLIRSGSTAYRATGALAWLPFHLGLLARACEIAGQVGEAVALLDDALQTVESTGERLLEAELHRHRGELLLRNRHREAAEEMYSKALSIAQEQEARLWELRAAVSLARLRRDQGRRAEARDLLAPIYSWFTEGFDAPDLKEAKALLDELGRDSTVVLN
jgi:class 3 adenylate cyclase/predicted ATPase/DNA polymerase III delta prime subunit